MNKSRLSLLIGALMAVVMLSGCALASKGLNAASSILGGIAGDRSNTATAVVGQVGDFYGAVGKTLEETNPKSHPDVSVSIAEAPEVAPTVAPVVEPVAVSSAKPTAKSAPLPPKTKQKSSAIKSVAATTGASAPKK